MSNKEEGRDCALPRRLLLQRGVGAIGAAALIAARTEPVSATVKISKAAVAYQDHPQDDKRCGKCLQFQAPDNCKLVDGPVSPQGFCRIFTPARQAGRLMRAARPIG
jgi:hypothetical protein